MNVLLCSIAVEGIALPKKSEIFSRGDGGANIFIMLTIDEPHFKSLYEQQY